MGRDLVRMARRAIGKPPIYIAKRVLQEIRSEADRFLAPRRADRFGASELLTATESRSIEELWQRLASRPYVAITKPIARNSYDLLCANDSTRIANSADSALLHQVSLLGSGDVALGTTIDWHKDYKSGFRWAPKFCRDIDFRNPDQPSDVKFPWELSRLQWLLPCGQAYLLTGDEKWADGVRRIIDDWIASNPLAGSVNWSCTMEVGMRVLTWTWLFHVFCRSAAWRDVHFRTRFLSALFLHGEFVGRNLEYSDVNGNHCDAGAAGLVFAGLFFGDGRQPERWLKYGWDVLTDEIVKQVSVDGVDFEGSVPYHRLVTELFFLPALYRTRSGLDVSPTYRERVIAMGRFAVAFTRPDGTAPVWGDADDARALAFGGQYINDHRYLAGWIGHALEDVGLVEQLTGDLAECVWLLGQDATTSIGQTQRRASQPGSLLFKDGGYAILRNERDHVFVDCAGVGLGGRGGHGHNDALSCEVFLDGCHLVTDSGAYVYTADYAARNAFRSTAFHNTPQVDRMEINRFMDPQDLWWLHDDAKAAALDFQTSPERDILVASHRGYERLASPVIVTRTYYLEHATHALRIEDHFNGLGDHFVEVPVHLPLGVVAEVSETGVRLNSKGIAFVVTWANPLDWEFSVASSEVSLSYGVRKRSTKLIWQRNGPLRSLSVSIAPEHNRTESRGHGSIRRATSHD